MFSACVDHGQAHIPPTIHAGADRLEIQHLPNRDHCQGSVTTLKFASSQHQHSDTQITSQLFWPKPTGKHDPHRIPAEFVLLLQPPQRVSFVAMHAIKEATSNRDTSSDTASATSAAA